MAPKPFRPLGAPSLKVTTAFLGDLIAREGTRFLGHELEQSRRPSAQELLGLCCPALAEPKFRKDHRTCHKIDHASYPLRVSAREVGNLVYTR